MSKMAERMHSPSSSTFSGLIIANVVFTDVKLGRGADATVYEVDWIGTLCAAKRLHDILLEDESAGGVAKLIGNFEAECLTWSKLRHPGVVQFLGVYLDRRSRLPVLVMEKMDTSLRTYLEDCGKEAFPLHQKTFVLRQVTQAMAYLHSQNPPLVHHDLSPNNVLLNVVSFVAKVSDFGMSRAINPSILSRKSSIKGTLAFMAPEALHDPPRYNEKLDVFSFGNVVISTLTHEWPNPHPPTQYQGEQLIALNELQRREHYVAKFTAQEKQLFFPTICHCLENRPDKRSSSAVLVQDLIYIESTLRSSGHVAAPIEQLHQQLSAKEEECRQKDEVIRENDLALKEKGEVINEYSKAMKLKDEALKEKDEVIKENSRAMRLKDEALKEKDSVMRTMQTDMQQLRSQNSRASEIQRQLSAKEEECSQKDEVIKEKNAIMSEIRQELSFKEEECRQKDEEIREKNKVLRLKDEALNEKDVVMRTMRADFQQLRSRNSRTSEQLAAKETECRQREEVVREQRSTIRLQQAEIQRLRDQPAVPQEVS